MDDKISDEKLQDDINIEAAKISALSSGNVYKYEYLTDEEILPFNQRRMIEQVKFAYSPLGEAFQKNVDKQVDALESLGLSNKDELKQMEGILPQNLMNDLICGKLKEIVQLQNFIKKMI